MTDAGYMSGARVRHVRRKLTEALLSTLSKDELLDLHEHWLWDTTTGGNSLFWEVSRFVATTAPEHFRDTPRRLVKGDSVLVKKGCSCHSCAPFHGKILQVYSTEKEEKALLNFNTSPSGKSPIVRLARPDGHMFGCCISECNLELVGPGRVSNVRVTTIRSPEPLWGIETPEEAEALVRLNTIAKVVGSGEAPPETESLLTPLLHDELEETDEIVRIEQLESEVERLWTRVRLLVGWAAAASAIAFGLALAAR